MAEPPLVLDGGLATRLEAYGRDLGGGLWSARLLAEEPSLIARVHRDYFEAGADVAIAAGYQASVDAFTARGHSRTEALGLIARSVEVATAERDAFGAGLVAAGVGPYGASLADGSEYTGDYDLDEDGLYRWHRERWRVLAGAGADLVACETLPSVTEARALARLVGETPGVRAWFSFSCVDDTRISDGTPFRDVAAELAPLHEEGRVVAVGVNCVPPSHVPRLVREVASAGLPAVAYPNSGEVWDAGRGVWTGSTDVGGFGAAAAGWCDEGAVLVGGCCRTGPGHVRAVREALDARSD
ncbi:homocysteine S-methyltransferase [Nocardiopsis sp. MG754419]|uniref:homocysteine S-methyltransferase n=1 Tax=Nocardiopsis sp. MG754419 TaxID=2259865 RepID=UPI001BA971BA|nr:homocysteine S-methyltransferase [Nocardiopsis sp. MG754419]MBR8741571.1 homocysteine S-methyltransferase [Nocardiopsis sp. MG754419]